MVNGEMKAGRRVSMAALQGTFIRNGPAEAVRATKELFVKR
jgi:chaperone BCS1